MESCEVDIEQVEGMGGALIKQCVSSDGEMIKKKLAKLRQVLETHSHSM